MNPKGIPKYYAKEIVCGKLDVKKIVTSTHFG